MENFRKYYTPLVDTFWQKQCKYSFFIKKILFKKRIKKGVCMV